MSCSPVQVGLIPVPGVLLLFCVWLCHALAPVMAQEGRALPPAAPTVQDEVDQPAPVPAPGHESEAETIRKCLSDVRSEDVGRRRRAVMILGKYRAAPAIDAVVSCLQDTDAEVRRSAAVAVSEWDSVPPAAQSAVLRLIGDENVHVRRVASSMLPEILGGRFGLGGIVVLAGNGPAEVAASQDPDVATGEALNRALGDEDVTVRRNVLTAARYVPGVLRQETLVSVLRDPDREVRLLAVQNVARLRGDEAERGQMLAAAVADPDSAVRSEAAGALGRLGASGFAGLERLAGDPDPGVRIRAVRELVQLQHPRGLELIERCVMDDAIPADERRSLLLYVGFYGENARALLTRLADDRSALLRAEAVRGLSRLSGTATEGGVGFLLLCLEDDAVEVRRVAAQGLTQWLSAHRPATDPAAWPTAADLSRLQDSAFADVRLLAVRLTALLPQDTRVSVLADACLDDDTPVRCEAILHLALLGTPAANELVERSLDDPDSEVVMAAIRGLSMRPSGENRQLLQAFHDRCQDGAIKALVANVLADMARGGPVRVRPPRSVVPGALPAERILPQRMRPVPRVPRAVPPAAPPP